MSEIQFIGWCVAFFGMLSAGLFVLDWQQEARARGDRLIWHFRRPRWLRRGCRMTAADARWLAHALAEPACPFCDRPLARHR
jgi:hypothetical protein